MDDGRRTPLANGRNEGDALRAAPGAGMTVRAWFTISAVVLVLLGGAVAYRLLAPVAAPEILARSGDVRLDGARVMSCWPARGGALRCRGSQDVPAAADVPPSGTLRFLVAYPVQPDTWQITVARGRRTVMVEDEPRFRYDLDAGTYAVDVQARYPADAFVHYRFRFRVR